MRQSVLVIGSGVAGLVAAQSLAVQNYSVLPLEARSERYGGRLWTDQTTFGMPLDLGASWILGIINNPIKRLVNTLHIQTATTSYDRSVLYDSQGSETSEDAIGLALLETEIAAAIEAGQTANTDQSLYDCIRNGTGANSKTAEQQVLLRFSMSRQFETEAGGRVSGILSNGQRASAESELQEIHLLIGQKPQPTEHRWRGSGICEGLFAGCRSPGNRAEHPTRRAGYRYQLLWQHGQDDDQQRQLHGRSRGRDGSAGCAQKECHRLHPALPASHNSAISQIGMGVLNKLYLQFDTAFWGTNVDWIESIPAASDGSQTWTEWVSFKSALGVNVLLGFSAAYAAIELEKLSDADIVNSAMTRPRSIYGNVPTAPVMVMRWHSQCNVLGVFVCI